MKWLHSPFDKMVIDHRQISEVASLEKNGPRNWSSGHKNLAMNKERGSIYKEKVILKVTTNC